MEANPNKLIALCTSRIYDPQVHGYIESLCKELNDMHCSLLVYTINSDLYWKDENISAEVAVFDLVPFETADIIIIMDEKIKNHKISEKLIAEASKVNKPVIVIDGHYENVYQVNFDYASGFEQVVRHVLDTGRVNNPHMMAGIPNNPFSDERIEIFKKIIGEYGIVFSDDMVSFGDFWAIPARRATEKLIASKTAFDAIICANDIMAINVCDVLQQNGYRVPEDVLISGFDGYNEVFATTPKITTVSCTTPELVDGTLEIIHKIFAGNKTPSDHREISVLPKLIKNESTLCSPESGYDHYMLNNFNNNFYRHQDAVRLMYKATIDMQMSSAPDEMLSHLRSLIINDEDILEDVSFAVNKDLFYTDEYFFDRKDLKTKPSNFSYVYDPEVGPGFYKAAEDELQISLHNPHFFKKIKNGYPLIFNTIDYLNTPIGVICYSFSDFDITKYSRTPDIVHIVSSGIGGFVSMLYQRSLTQKIENMYRMDSLTGLYNRIGFNQVFDELLHSENIWGFPITVIMSDLDGLKYINDNFGHGEGDNAIATVAKALKQACPHEALCVRFGGDEISAVIIGKCDPDSIISEANRILDAYNSSSGKEYTVRSSCGFHTSVFSEDFDIKEALRIADEQMYSVKKRRHG